MSDAPALPEPQQIVIRVERLQRWHDAAKELGSAGHALLGELANVCSNPSRENLASAAKAARAAQGMTTGGLWMIANATAAELENATI